MCGRIVIVYDAALGRWVTQRDAAWEECPATAAQLRRSRYNVTPRSPVVVMVGGRAPALEVARWGIPFPGGRHDVINTRIEGAFESPLWRGLIGKRHCIIPVTGFYEWDHASGSGQPHFFQRSDGNIMALAGLAGPRSVNGEERLCFSIVTCPSNQKVAALHDRMPVILETGDEAAWLAPEEAGTDGLLELAVPAADGVLKEHAVSAEVNQVGADAPALIRPVPASRQAKLL